MRVAQVALPVLVALAVLPFLKPYGSWWPYAPSMVDLDVYRYTGQVLLEGGDILTARVPAERPEDRLAFLYPPFAALLCVPLALVPQLLLQVLITVASVLALLAVLYRLGLAGWVLSLVTTGCVLLVEPVRETIGFGQVNVLLMALVVCDLVPGPHLLLRGRRLLPAGVLTGLAALIKLTPGLFAVYLLFARRRRTVWTVLLTFAALALAAAVVLPAETMGFVRLLWEGETRTGDTGAAINQSLLAATLRLAGDSEAARYAGLAGGAVVAVVGAYAAALWDRRGQRAFAVVLCGSATLLASPLSWTHHFVWAAPLAVVLIRGSDLPRSVRVLGLGFVAWACGALFRYTHFGERPEPAFQVVEVVLENLGPVLGVALVGLAVVTAHRTGSARKAPVGHGHGDGAGTDGAATDRTARRR